MAPDDVHGLVWGSNSGYGPDDVHGLVWGSNSGSGPVWGSTVVIEVWSGGGLKK
jgi:hypothetical protein